MPVLCRATHPQVDLQLLSAREADEQGKWDKTVLQLDDYLGLGKPGFNSPSAPGSLQACHAASLYLHPCLSHGVQGSRN